MNDANMHSSRTANPALPPLDLSVVMPCFNEAEHIEATLREWEEMLKSQSDAFELLVINDGSKDGTGRILDRLRKEMRTLRVVHQLNLGHDRAIRRGYETARGRYIAQVDLNGTIEASEFPRLWSERLERHLVLAKRVRRLDGPLADLLAHLLLRATRLLFHSELKDPTAPFRIFRRDAALPFLANLPTSLENINLALSLLLERQYPRQVGEVDVAVATRRSRRRRRSSLSVLGSAWGVARELMRLRVEARALSGGAPVSAASQTA